MVDARSPRTVCIIVCVCWIPVHARGRVTLRRVGLDKLTDVTSPLLVANTFLVPSPVPRKRSAKISELEALLCQLRDWRQLFSLFCLTLLSPNGRALFSFLFSILTLHHRLAGSAPVSSAGDIRGVMPDGCSMRNQANLCPAWHRCISPDF